ATSDFPHLLIYGPSGAGKKTCISCLLEELYGPGVRKFSLFSPAVMSTLEIPFFVRIDKAISSYFENKPTLWSDDSFLEKLKPLIMEDEVAELSSEINNDDMKDEQARYIADLLSNQVSFLSILSTTQGGCCSSSTQELGDIISPKTVGVVLLWTPGGCRPLFLANSPIEVSFFFGLLGGCRPLFLANSPIGKLTATNASFWKKLKMEKNRKLSEANLHHKKTIHELDQYINTNSKDTTMNILEIAKPAKCSEQDDESTKSDEGTIAKLLAQILQNKFEKAGSLAQNEDQRLSLKKCQSEIDFTQDEDQKLLLKKHQLEIEESELPKSKKFEAVTDSTQNEDQGILKELTDFTQDEDRRLSLREHQLSIEEREIKLERKRIELMKLKKSLI
ncbi:2896_t:CDS:10, partial [Funneliformis mosseae]